MGYAARSVADVKREHCSQCSDKLGELHHIRGGQKADLEREFCIDGQPGNVPARNGAAKGRASPEQTE